jgi:nucleoside-diphosphate-sugar epimerase
VLLTGATGFVGGAVANELLADPRVGRLVLLVRGSSTAHAERRACRSIERFSTTAETLAAASGKIEVLLGDLDNPTALESSALDGVTHAIHAAASTSFLGRSEATRTNVSGTLALVRALGRRRSLERFLHVSTAYCCGANPPRVVVEEDGPRGGSRHLTEYTRSKAECELKLRETDLGAPIVIARPSVVIGHSALGCRPSASIFWYYAALARLGRAPFPPDRRRDIVPVDWVARALSHLLFKEVLAHRIYHVSAGERSSASWAEISDAFARAGWRGRKRGFEVLAPHAISEPPEALHELSRGRNARRLALALRAYAKFGALGVDWFANERLIEEGVEPSPRFTDYLPLCLESTKGASIAAMLDDDA